MEFEEVIFLLNLRRLFEGTEAEVHFGETAKKFLYFIE